ncbi:MULTISPECIES: DUF4232 domain-containing protein [unclassified Streptomyces]|uniref:DUF4232 domain-containing protein n=1 Tax=unclassified Streptomyces TaxID=2593676 RepID=UPI002E81DBF3|nr:DUF4232 domain-containing protein [Streptomyces sp. NBC_00589]WTI37305.1 DUF4232 domain-containing protein [Streptomyces sp. NBC_00775]WUB29018.1 DUF4232 domain-containing protein [Streptomyces sp. NBC_00589]
MRALPLAATALLAALALTACDDGAGGDTKSSSKASTGATDSTDSAACAIDQIGFQVGPANAAPAAGDTGNVPVTLTNRGAKCTLKGFPGIDLYAGNVSATVGMETSATPEKLSLSKNDTASFTITYVRGAAGDAKSLDAKTVKISLPGATATQNFPWSYGPVVGKSGAGDPNASVSPFQHAGD